MKLICFLSDKAPARTFHRIQYVQDGIDMIDDFIETRKLWKEALAEGMKNNHSIYDMYYAILARRKDATLITNDGALAKVCEKLSIDICN